jgi:C-terminal processing protease CtpA/Prc
LKNAKGIIFDVRGYPQYYALSVLSHLIDSFISVGHLRGSDYFFPNQQNAVYRKTEFSTWYIASATASNSAEYAKKYGYVKPEEEHIACPVVFLTDANALSFGETFMQMVKNYQIGTIIGEPTAGTNGDARFDLEVIMTGIKFTNHDNSRFHGIGVIPDMIVRREVGEIDNVLEYAKSYIREKTDIIQ